MTMLEIKDLHAKVGDKEILKGVNLVVDEGEVMAIMGPNGCGKSTLSAVITGNSTYTVTKGSISFKGKDLLKMSPDERANFGVFLAFQRPIELPGVSMVQLLKAALNSKRKFLKESVLDAVQFMKHLKLRANALGITDEMLKRSVNVGFSGGEKKRLETLQMAVLEPDFCILDEMDSGLDVDALKIVGQAISMVMRDEKRSFLIITHHDDLLRHVAPDKVAIMQDGKILKVGSADLVSVVEENGYEAFK